MTEKQKNSLKVTATLIGLMLVYPPYRIYGYGSNSNAIIESGYSLIFALPDRATIDFLTLLIQWVGIGLVGAAIYHLNKNQ
jgi:hypothetical protein